MCSALGCQAVLRQTSHFAALNSGLRVFEKRVSKVELPPLAADPSSVALGLFTNQCGSVCVCFGFVSCAASEDQTDVGASVPPSCEALEFTVAFLQTMIDFSAFEGRFLNFLLSETRMCHGQNSLDMAWGGDRGRGGRFGLNS